MTLNELTNSYASQWGKENDYITLRRIEKQIISARATVIQRRYDQTKIFPQSVIMTLRCKEVIKVDKEECDCFCEGVTLWRSKQKIPLPIIVKDDSYFMFVGNPQGIISFSSIKAEEVQDIKYRKFSSNQNFYFYTNNYLYFTNSLNGFTTRFVPENPLDILKLGECDCGCIEDGEMIIENSLEEPIAIIMANKKPLILGEKEEVTIDGNS